MAKMNMQRIDLDKGDTLQPKTITVWRGEDSPYGYVISYDLKATGGNPGLIIPALVDIPVAPQFQTLLGFGEEEIDLDDYDKLYDGVQNNAVPVWKAKGFRKVKDAIDPETGKPRRPTQEVAEFHIERFVGERRAEMRAMKYRPEDIDAECAALRGHLYKVNGFKAPVLDPIAGIMDRYYSKGGELGEAARDEAADAGAETETPEGEKNGKGKGRK